MTKPSEARAIADVTEGMILATVEIAAPPARVFAALTQSEEIVRWWGSDELYRTTAWTADFRVGGRWRADGVGADGSPFFVEGEFLEIDPPHRLVQTWRPPFDGGHTTTLSYRLEPTELGTRVTLRHSGFTGRPDSCRSHANGWVRVFGWLAAHLRPAAPPAAAPKYFLCKLIAPRPTFPFDMTEAEAAAMKAHAGYWTRLVAGGSVPIVGPVADPAGPWGCGIVAAADQAAVEALLAEDPVIRAGLGLRWEILPFLTAIVPG
jgi:uncharacterized protein YndB with AHSA1/START domain